MNSQPQPGQGQTRVRSGGSVQQGNGANSQLMVEVFKPAAVDVQPQPYPAPGDVEAGVPDRVCPESV